MKYFSIKIFILCILLPPMFYLGTVQGLESYLQKKYSSRFEKICPGNTSDLLEGAISLKEAVNNNVESFIRDSRFIIGMGADFEILVSTRKGQLLYPAEWTEKDARQSLGIDSSWEDQVTAQENFRLLNEGLKINFMVTLGFGTFLSFAILFLYLLISLIFGFYHYRSVIIKAGKDEARKSREISSLYEKEKVFRQKMDEIAKDRSELLSDLSRLKANIDQEKLKASRTEEELFEEIDSLEQTLNKSRRVSDRQKEEIEELSEKLQQFERRKGGKQKRSSFELASRRFKTLYKGTHIGKRALSGYNDLTEEMKIKAEEVIHQLNEDSSAVVVKRKVFAKKSSKTSLEVIFAYNGRLYFRKDRSGKVNVLAIGTKNTQDKDLSYLDSL